MLGLLGIGVAMIAGAGLRIAAVTGTLLMLFMYLAELPPVLGGNNPIVDSHWHEALLLIIAAVTLSGDTWGLGKMWARMIGARTWLR
jgi:thiosulfate dehydrogenase [quinone] large subunit